MSKLKKHWVESFTGKTILDAMPEVAYVFNKDQELLLWNKNTEEVLGYTAEELYRKNASEFVEEQDVDKNIEAFENLFSTHGEQVIYQNLVAKSGKKIPILDTANYATIDGEEYLIGLAIDITQLRKTEDELKGVIIELSRLKEKLSEENTYLREEYKGYHNYDEILGVCELTLASKAHVEAVAPLNSNVLITGEIGTQKELYARVIHNKSARKNQPFIMADCSSSLELRMESKLFGHEKGSFDGANEKWPGKIEMANNGTIFLYEVGELSMLNQAKLYRFLNESIIERMGSTVRRKADVRVIASSRHNLEELVQKGLFREDLYYRLNVYPIHLAPLRKKRLDIQFLTQHFLNAYNIKLRKNVGRVSNKIMSQLEQYSWPGNVRELENVIERAVIISNGKLLNIEPLRESKARTAELGFLSLAEYERNYIIQVLESTSWRVEGEKGAAVILDMNPETLRSRMRKLEIKRP